MLTYKFSTDKVLQEIADDIAKAPKTMNVYLTKTIPDLINRQLEPLRYEPPQSGLPFIWSHNPAKQNKARRWWFANLKNKTKGGRYVRTHGLAQGWKVEVTGQGANVSIQVVNPAARAVKWTQSIFQVPSHERSGWVEYEDVLLKAETQTEESIIDTWFSVLLVGNLV